jgi:hypothetical protein
MPTRISNDNSRSHRDRFAWMEDVLADADLTKGEKLVALRLAFYKNLKTGRCYPSVQTIARGVSTPDLPR